MNEYENFIGVSGCVLRMEPEPIFGFGINCHPFAIPDDLPAAFLKKEEMAQELQNSNQDLLLSVLERDWAKALACAQARWLKMEKKWGITPGRLCVVESFLGEYIGFPFFNSYKEASRFPYHVQVWRDKKLMPDNMVEAVHGGIVFRPLRPEDLTRITLPPLAGHVLLEALSGKGKIVEQFKAIDWRDRGTVLPCYEGRAWHDGVDEGISYEHISGMYLNYTPRRLTPLQKEGLVPEDMFGRIVVAWEGERAKVAIRRNMRGWRIERFESRAEKRLSDISIADRALESLVVFLKDCNPEPFCVPNRKSLRVQKRFGDIPIQHHAFLSKLLEQAYPDAAARSQALNAKKKMKKKEERSLKFDPKKLFVGQMLVDGKNSRRVGQVGLSAGKKSLIGFGGCGNKRLTPKVLAGFEVIEENLFPIFDRRVFPYHAGLKECAALGFVASEFAKSKGMKDCPFVWNDFSSAVPLNSEMNRIVLDKGEWKGGVVFEPSLYPYRFDPRFKMGLSFGIVMCNEVALGIYNGENALSDVMRVLKDFRIELGNVFSFDIPRDIAWSIV